MVFHKITTNTHKKDSFSSLLVTGRIALPVPVGLGRTVGGGVTVTVSHPTGKSGAEPLVLQSEAFRAVLSPQQSNQQSSDADCSVCLDLCVTNDAQSPANPDGHTLSSK